VGQLTQSLNEINVGNGASDPLQSCGSNLKDNMQAQQTHLQMTGHHICPSQNAGRAGSHQVTIIIRQSCIIVAICDIFQTMQNLNSMVVHRDIFNREKNVGGSK
jgi:hypothetical protein